MRNGLKITLSMVAFAFTGMQAMAMAPIIGEIPSPIVGDEGSATGSAVFVYPDALDLPTYVTDSDGPSAIVWSYDVSTAQIYSINGVAPLGTDDPVAPPAAKQITAAGNLDPADGDSNPATVTIRNIHLSPIGGGGPGDTGLPVGIVASETQLVTLYASDGATYSEKDVFVYTDNDGNDRLSGGGDVVYAPGTPALSSGATAWKYFGRDGSPVSSSSASTGICITVPVGGDNYAEWYSAYNTVSLVANSVYQARINFTTNQATPNQVPLFSFIWDNSDPDDPFGAANIYASEMFVLDNIGGANAPAGAPNGLAAHYSVFAPPQVLTAQWNANGFTPTNDPINDMRLRFTMADFSSATYGADQDSGRVCLQDIVVTRYDINTLSPQAVSPAYNVTNLDVTPAGGQTHTWRALANTRAPSVSDAGGNLTIIPPSGGWDFIEVFEVRPGDTNSDVLNGGASLIDNYPLPWTANTVYMGTWGMSAPDAISESNPPDLMRFGFDTPTQELSSTGQVSASLQAAAMPKQIAGSVTAPQPYVAFFHTNGGTLSTVPEHDRIRPRFDIIVTPDLTYNGIASNTGGTRIHSEMVQTVVLP